MRIKFTEIPGYGYYDGRALDPEADLDMNGAEVRELLAFAARGIRDRNVLVEMCILDRHWGVGRCSIRYRAKGQTASIFLHPFRRAYQERGRAESAWIRRRFPDGVRVESLRDQLVFLAAAAFRKIWCWRRRETPCWKTPRRRLNEVDRFALARLNEYREATGRSGAIEESGSIPKELRRAATLRRFRSSPVAAARVFGMPVVSHEEVSAEENLFDGFLPSTGLPSTGEEEEEDGADVYATRGAGVQVALRE